MLSRYREVKCQPPQMEHWYGRVPAGRPGAAFINAIDLASASLA